MALGSKYLEYEKRGGVAWLRLNRPEARNAFTREMYMGIVQACVDGDQDPDVQLTVLTGTGDAFSAGGDLRGGFMEDPNRTLEDIHSIPFFGSGPGALWPVDPFVTVQRAKKLVVAVVNGICHAGGFVLAMTADITIASDRATFRVPELLRGVADPWVAGRLPLYVGLERAKHMMFTCRRFDAGQALSWGLISEVAPHDELEQRVEALLDDILLTGPEARALYKATANRLLPDPDYEAGASSLHSDECREGFSAFSERRSPAWIPTERAAVLGRL